MELGSELNLPLGMSAVDFKKAFDCVEHASLSGFNLSEGCFGPTLSKTSPNGQIWDFTGSRYDGSAPNYIARLFYCEKIKKNGNMVQKNTKKLIFVKKIFEKLHA